MLLFPCRLRSKIGPKEPSWKELSHKLVPKNHNLRTYPDEVVDILRSHRAEWSVRSALRDFIACTTFSRVPRLQLAIAAMSNAGHAILRKLCHAGRQVVARPRPCVDTTSFVLTRSACAINTHNRLATNFLLRCRQSRTFSTSPASLVRQRGPPKKQTGVELDQSWRKHDPNEGIPLPNGDLSAEQLAEIGGPDLDVETGNKLLRIIQWRRLSGTLNDKEVSPLPERESDRKIYEKALVYLRAQYPMNERRAERAWADEEAKRLEAEILDIEKAKIVYGPQQGPIKHSKSHLQEMLKDAQDKAKKRQQEMERIRAQEMEKLRAEGKHIAVLQPPLALATTCTYTR